MGECPKAGFKKMIAITSTIVIFIIIMASLANANKETSLAALGLSEDDYCYNTKMGTRLYKGIPNKFCVCRGALIRTFVECNNEGERYITTSPDLSIMHDSSTVYCKGNITGYKFGYDGKEFSDLREWEDACRDLTDGQDLCFSNLNYTKSKLKNNEK